MSKRIKRKVVKPPSLRPGVCDAFDAASIPTLTIGLRPDGALCVVLPGLKLHARTPCVPDAGFASAVRRILEAQGEAASRSYQTRIGDDAEPTQDMLGHASHTDYDPRCPHCQYEMVANGLGGAEAHPRFKRVERKTLTEANGVKVQRVDKVWHCACGMSGSMREFAEHMSLVNPVFPKPPPKGFPHREVKHAPAEVQVANVEMDI